MLFCHQRNNILPLMRPRTFRIRSADRYKFLLIVTHISLILIHCRTSYRAKHLYDGVYLLIKSDCFSYFISEFVSPVNKSLSSVPLPYQHLSLTYLETLTTDLGAHSAPVRTRLSKGLLFLAMSFPREGYSAYILIAHGRKGHGNIPR